MTASTAIQPRTRRLPSALSLFEALTTPHGVDRYLELVNPMLSVRELCAEVTHVRRCTADTVTLTLRPTRHWRGFGAGQFVQITVEIDGVRRTRCYSPACSQYRSDGRIELTIKAHPDGVVSQYLHAHAAPGLVVGLSQADGTFRLPAARPGKVLLISGGSGSRRCCRCCGHWWTRGTAASSRSCTTATPKPMWPTSTSCATWLSTIRMFG